MSKGLWGIIQPARRQFYLAIKLASVMCFAWQPISAAPVFYNNETNFLAATGGVALQLEGFESLPVTAPTSTITATDFTITNTGGFNDINVQAFPPVTTEGSQTAVWRNSFGQFVVDFNSAVSAVSFDITDLATSSAPTDFSVSIDGGSFQTLFSFATNQPAFNQLFAGFVDTTGTFSQLIFTNDAAGDAINFDRVQYKTGELNVVTEPAHLLMFCFAIAFTGFVRRLEYVKMA